MGLHSTWSFRARPQTSFLRLARAGPTFSLRGFSFFMSATLSCGALLSLIAGKVIKGASSLQDSLVRAVCFLRMYSAQTICKNQNR